MAALLSRASLFRLSLLTACLAVVPGTILAAADTDPYPGFEARILPLLQAKCVACHSPQTRQGELDLGSLESLLEGGASGPSVVPGSAEQSLLFQKVETGEMPLGQDPLTPGELESIRRWIDQGALADGQDPAAFQARMDLNPGVTSHDVLVPILHVRCLICHGRRTQEAGLDLRTRASILKGGKSGPAMVPGKPEESLLLQRIQAEEMPPPKDYSRFCVRPVTSPELEKLRRWIADGAPEAPPNGASRASKGSTGKQETPELWSLQPPRRPAPPRVAQSDRVRNPIDAFLLEKLEARGLGFAPPSDRLVLMRRAYLDLVGLPPTPDEVRAYHRDSDPRAYERLVDRLLDSAHYGERWGRYWLDAAGYADSEGKVHADNLRPHAYRYRDYVIRSFNDDKPYDRFLLEQIAGDELVDYRKLDSLTPDEVEPLIATGFLRMAPDGTWSGAQNFVPERLDVVADQVEVLSSTVMGLTMACARCHDHKYDPLPQRDFYRFSAILRSAYDPYDWLIPQEPLIAPAGGPFPKRLLRYGSEEELREVKRNNGPVEEEIKRLKRALEEKAAPFRERLLREKREKIPEALRADVEAAAKVPEDNRTDLQKYLVEAFREFVTLEAGELEKRFEEYREEARKVDEAVKKAEKKLRRHPSIRALFDMPGKPTPNYLLARGEHTRPGDFVDPGIPSALQAQTQPYRIAKPEWSSGRRLALARWLGQPDHPLTARVMVNRIWQHHFGRGLVATPGNFGKLGAAPSHPELLDWLATEFVKRGWSVKAMHRLIMTSSAYRQSSGSPGEETGNGHSDNSLLSRFPLQRLDAEALRDSILKISGRLDSTPFGPADEVEVQEDGEVTSQCTSAGCRRSVYMLQRRTTPLTMLDTFDAPQLNPNCVKRSQSMVTSQALQLWNSQLARKSARHFAGRVIDAVGSDLESQVEQVYLAALSRWPTAAEKAAALEEIGQVDRHWAEHLESHTPAEPKRSRARWLALSTFCHAMLNSAEFIFY